MRDAPDRISACVEFTDLTTSPPAETSTPPPRASRPAKRKTEKFAGSAGPDTDTAPAPSRLKGVRTCTPSV